MASDHRRAGELSREGGDGSEVPPSVSSAPFGITRGGAVVCRHTLTGGGLVARCLDYGGAVQALEVPDRQGQRENVLLGYDALEGYEGDDCWCGVLCGPLAGRVAGASFELEGKRYALEANDSSGRIGKTLQNGQHPFFERNALGPFFCRNTLFAGPCVARFGYHPQQKTRRQQRLAMQTSIQTGHQGTTFEPQSGPQG